MPNWCEGVLKLRGIKKDLLSFAKNVFARHMYGASIIDDSVEIPLDMSINKYGDVFIPLSIKDDRDWIWFKDSKRMFPTKDIEWHLWNDDTDEEYVVELDVKQAWDIDTDYLLTLARTYNLDIKITAFELGMRFTREVEIVDNKVIRDKKTEYGDEYDWEVYDSRLGG